MPKMTVIVVANHPNGEESTHRLSVSTGVRVRGTDPDDRSNQIEAQARELASDIAEALRAKSFKVKTLP